VASWLRYPRALIALAQSASGRMRLQYWKSLPASSMVTLGLAVFFVFSTYAFVSDLAEPRPAPYWWVVVYAANTGIVAVGYILVSTRFVRALPLAVGLNLLSIFGLPKLLPLYSTQVPAGTTVTQLHQRHLVDAWLVFAAVLLGLVFLYTFVSTEGTKYFRMRTEIELAKRVQAELVPPIDLKTRELEICGKSIPSSSVGGDLVDAVVIDGTVTCYLADVSGHGIAAGVLMSMVKSAVRTAASQGVTLVELMQRLNTVLMDLKAPSMYATLAFLRFVGSDHLEYSLAGHPPVLHYHCSTHSVSPLKMEQLPIALFGTANFESRTIAIEPGDLLVTVSDGLLDVANRQGQEFGWEQIERLVLENAAEPLSFIVEKVSMKPLASACKRTTEAYSWSEFRRASSRFTHSAMRPSDQRLTPCVPAGKPLVPTSEPATA